MSYLDAVNGGRLSMTSGTTNVFVNTSDAVGLPSHPVELQRIMQGFLPLPNCLGAVDCTHVRIKKPKKNNTGAYRDRNHNHSVTMQVTADSSLRIIDCFIGWPGSVHDARIWSNSPFVAAVKSGKYLNGEHVLVEGVMVPQYVLGDSGYPLLPYIINPFSSEPTRLHRDFNYKHSSKRMCIERTFGRLKRKFPQLQSEVDLDIADVSALMHAACILHNITLVEECEEYEPMPGRSTWLAPPSTNKEAISIRLALAKHIAQTRV